MFKENEMDNIKKHLSLMGMKVKDKVTGKTGIVDSISFDLYGYVQASLNSGLDKDGEQTKFVWFDIGRLKVIGKKPVMEVPDYSIGLVAEGKKGPANKADKF